LAIVSPLADNELQERVDRSFASITTASPAAPPVTRHAPVIRPLTISWDFNPYIWIDIAQCTLKSTPAIRLAANILGHLLGGGPHSELFRTLRTERAIAYSAYADDLAYLGGTILHCFFCVHKRSLHAALDFVLSRLDEIAAQGIAEEQFESEKRRIVRWHEMAIDHPQGLAEFLAYERLRPQESSFYREGDFLRPLNELTIDHLKQAAAELLSSKSRTTFAAGRLGPLARFQVRRRLRKSLGR
jgi:predicted Zn-dependent peptidase